MKNYTWLVFTMELRKIISYRIDFWVNFLGQTLFSLIVYYFVWKSIYNTQGVESMNGFNLSQIVLYYLITPLVMRIIGGENIGHISREIYDGNLNKYLIYPVSYYKYKLTSYLAYSCFYIVQLFALLVFFKLLAPSPEVLEIRFVNLLMFVIAVLAISCLYFCLSSITELMAFWAEYIWSLGVIVRFIVGLLGGAMIPLAFFPEWATQILAFTPFPYLVSFPVMVLMQPNYDFVQYLTNLAIVGIWGTFFFSISFWLWRKGNLQYTGIGM